MIQSRLPKCSILTACLLVVFCGCDNKPKVTGVQLGGSTGTMVFGSPTDGQPGIDYGSIFFAGRRIVVWTDGRSASAGWSGGPDGVTGQGRVIAHSGDEIAFSFEIKINETGTATMAEHTYQLEDGTLFLVAFGDDGPRFKQLKRDLSNVELKLESLKSFMRHDTEFKTLFAAR